MVMNWKGGSLRDLPLTRSIWTLYFAWSLLTGVCRATSALQVPGIPHLGTRDLSILLFLFVL
jgi:hypothetical protein